MRSEEVGALAAAIRRDFGDLPTLDDTCWNAPPPVKVIDCVLSLNRRYETVVAPRVDRFGAARPELVTCEALRQLIREYDSPALFLQRELDTNDPQRATTLSGVVDFVLSIEDQFDGTNEEARLEQRARCARPEDHLSVGVKGFGLAGFQYLRMLFGAETTKPDVHVLRYVSSALKHQVSPVQSLYLLEAAALQSGISIRRLDGAIWQQATG